MNQSYYFVSNIFCSLKVESFLRGASAKRKNHSFGMAFLAVLMLSLLGSISAHSQTTYYSKATAVDFNDVSSWGTANDGTGTSPATISNADNFIVANNAALSLTGNAAVRELTINSGSLTVASNVLTVSKATGYNATLSIASGGTLNVTGGTINLNGNFTMANGSGLVQSGGNIVIDGNDGGATATSVAASTPLFRIGNSTTSYSSGTLNLTGGTITIVDPHAASSASTGYAVYVYFPSGYTIESGPSHTFIFGDGISTTAGGHASGFYVDPYVSTGKLNFGSLVINNPSGTNRVVVTPFAIGAHGNVSVTAGEFRPNALTLRGNLTVNGTFVATNTFALAVPSGTSSTVNNAAQNITIATGGIIKNAASAETANFTSLTVNNTAGVTFQGTSAIASQPANSLSVSGTLNFTAGKVTTSGISAFVLGNSSPSAGTLTYTSGGFTSGTTFGRWFTATGAGTSITPGTDATSATSRYPFVNSTDQDRSAWIERVTAAAAAGVLGVTYNETAGISTVNLTEGTFTADRKINDTWGVASLAGTPTAAASFKLQVQAPGSLAASLLVATTRIVQGNTFVGTHQAGTVTPAGQRILTAAELTAAPFSIVYSTTGIPVTTIASGNWNDPAIWSSGAVPTCTDAILISANTTVTVNSAAAVTNYLSIAANGTLVVASGDLTVGCTLNNTSLINNGTLTVSGGILNINGNMLHAAGSTFNHSAGDINVDGNNGGDAATSVASGTAIVQINTQNVNWTGGMLTIVDPHASSTATNTFAYTNSTAHVNVTAGHTIRFGNGTSTDAGGNATNGFRVATFPGSNRISFFNFIVNGGSGTNRFVSNTSAYGINGNMTITAGSEYRDGNTTHIAGNLVNNGSYIAANTVAFQSFLNGTAAPATVAQTVTGTGTFANATTAPTANLSSLTINNTSADGVTFGGFSNIASQPANSVSVSGTLTFTAGKLNSAGNAVYVLGTSAPAAGTLSYTAGGFASGVTFGRWFTAAGTGSSFTAGTDVTTATSRYPFVNSANQNRSAWIERVSPSGAAGILGMTYNNVAGTTAITATDGTFAVDTKGNDTWAVSAIQGTPLAATTFKLQIQAPGMFAAPLTTATTRVIQGSAFVGTHQAGTVTPGGQRVSLTAAELTAAPFTLAVISSDIPFAAIANGNWNDAAIWNKGSVPGCNDVVTIPSTVNVTVNSAANSVKGLSILAGGTLTIASGDLTVGCTLNNATLTNNGTLTVTGGTLNINGNINNTSTSTFNQSGGTIQIDGSNGVVAESVASGTPHFNMASNNITLTGGTLLFVDPHTATTNTSGLSLRFTTTTANTATLTASPNHTTQFGDGVSTTAGGNASGFYTDMWADTGFLSLGTVIANGGNGTNRGLGSAYQLAANGDVTVNTGSTLTLTSALIVGGNLKVDGTFVNAGVVASLLASNTSSNLAFAPAVNAQTFTNNGTIANSATTVTANFTNLQVNNTNAAGVTLASPFSVSGTLTLTAGKFNTTTANILTLGTATAAGTLTGGSATAYINGPFARTIATGNAATNYILFPVGKAAYAPVWLAPTTTAVSVFKAEAFDTNTGTMDASILNLSTTRRWEAPMVSGAFTDIKVRLGDAGIVATNIPVQAPAAAGAYAGTLGSSATFTAGTPNTIQSINAVTAANYTGFLSFADSNSCMGVPAPGNTIASANNICAGTPVTLSVQNQTTGSGVSYQWQSSVNGTDFDDIATATNTTYSTVPAAALHYRLKVVCAAGPDTAYSTPVHITFQNNITATTPAARCGTGSVTLNATGSAGSEVRWYTAPTGGSPVATGTSFNTPSVNTTTTFYAAAEVGDPVVSGGGKTTVVLADGGTAPINYGLVFNATSAFTLNTVDIYLNSTTAGTLVVVLQNSAGTPLQTASFAVPAGNATTPVLQTLNLGWTIPVGTGYRLLAVSGPSMIREFTGTSYPYAIGSVGSITSGYISGTSATYYYFYNWSYGAACSSPRVPVIATVNPAPAFTLSTNATAICTGETTAAVTITAGAADYDTYSWTPSTGVTGSAATGWTFNPTVTTTYTLNASQSTGDMCVANAATVVVTVNSLPNAVTIASPTEPACLDSVVTLTATGGVYEATLLTENFNALSTQFVTATVSGTPAATLNSTYFAEGSGSVLFKTTSTSADVSYSTNSNINLTGFSSAQLTFSHIAAMEGTTNSYDLGYVQYSTDGGTTWTTFPSSSYAGAGTLITTQGTATPVSGVIFSTKSYPDWLTQFTGSTATPGTGPATALWKTETINIPASALNNPQFRIRFRYTTDSSTSYYGWLIDNVSITAQNTNITWAPAANLYTDAAATIPYVAGTNVATVYAKSATAATTTYTATAASIAGCTTTDTADVTVINCAIDAANLQSPATASIYTCESQVVTGQVFKTGVTEAAGAATGMKAWVGVSSTNTDPATWAEADWHLAAFSTQAGNNDEFTYTITGLPAGTYYYATRNQYLTGAYVYGGLSGFWNGTTSTNGTLTVNAVTLPTTTDLTYCNEAPTIATLKATVTGTDVKVYTAATGGTALTDATLLVSGTYHISQTINGCEGPRAEVDVTLNTTVAPVTTNAAFCNAAPTVADLATYATGTGLKWYAALTGGTELASTTALVAGDYFVSQTINGCEGPRGTVTVTLNTTVMPTANNITLCGGSTVADLSAAATGTNLKWYAALTGGTELASTTVLVAGDYFVSQTINGCEGPRATVTVTLDVITAPVVTLVQPTCTTATGSITVTAPVGTGYTYSIDGTNFQASATFAALVPGTYTVTAKNATNCTAATANIVINAAPALPTFTATPTQPTCAVATGSVTVGDMGATDYTFSIDGTNFQASPTFTGLAAGDYTITVQTTAGCTATASITINAAPAVPLAPTALGTQTFCAGATVANIEVTTGTSLQWYASLTGNDPIAATTPLVNGTSYFVSQNNGTCESTRTEVVVTITTVNVDDIADQVVACGTYTLPALTNGNYFGGTNGTGTAYDAGDVISSDMTMYIFNQAGECTAETSFTIDVNVIAVPAGDAIQTVTVNNPADATLEDLTVTVTGTLTWYATEADALAGTNPLALTTQLANNEDYFAVQTIGTCSSAPFEVTVTVTLGRNDFDIQNIKVYPNPVVEKLVISYSSNITLVEVYDLLGKRVIVEQPNATTANINMSHLEAATYIVKITADGMTKDVKVVKGN